MLNASAEESGDESGYESSDLENIRPKKRPEPHYSDWLIGSRGLPVES